MSSSRSRREFLGITAAGIASVAAADLVPETLAAPVARPASGNISVTVTDAARKFSDAPAAKWESARGAVKNTITVEPAKRFQEMLGFGAAFTDAACYMFNTLEPSKREELLRMFFDSRQAGLSVCRTCMGASDYATKVYSYADERDPELRNFSIEHDKTYILPSIRMARKINPDLFLFASPWSPPGWMKPNGSMLGGCMKRGSIPVYAQYFLKFLQAYNAEGVLVNAVSTQNETDTEQDGRMPACAWPQEYEIEFVGEHLGPLLENNGMKTHVWMLDHNYNLWGRAICTLDNPAVKKYSNAIAWHGYVGNPEMMQKVHAAHPDAQMFWTEGGPEYDSPKYGTEWSRWSETFTGIVRNHAQSIIGWNLALDEVGRPNIGPFNCGGLVTIHSRTKQITESGQYWAMSHWSRKVKRGARRIESQSALKDVHHAAFENTNGQRVLMITNPGAAREINVALGKMQARIALPADAIVSLTWQ